MKPTLLIAILTAGVLATGCGASSESAVPTQAVTPPETLARASISSRLSAAATVTRR